MFIESSPKISARFELAWACCTRARVFLIAKTVIEAHHYYRDGLAEAIDASGYLVPLGSQASWKLRGHSCRG
jgi:hypothetical protein